MKPNEGPLRLLMSAFLRVTAKQTPPEHFEEPSLSLAVSAVVKLFGPSWFPTADGVQSIHLVLGTGFQSIKQIQWHSNSSSSSVF